MRQQTFHKALSHLTATGFRAFFIACLVFAVFTGFYNLWLCLAEIAAVLVLYLYFHINTARRREDVLAYLDHVTNGVDSASRRTMIASPMPIVIFRPDTDDIIWSNERFLHLTGDRDHIFDTKLASLVPAFQSQWLLDGEHCSPEPVPVGDRQFLVFGNLVSISEDQEGEFLATTYWVDVTHYAETAARYDDTRPVLMLLQVDNYEDLGKGLDEGERSALRTQLNNLLTEWLEPAQGMICRYDRDHYLFFMEAGKLQEFYRRKFSILEEIRQVQGSNGVAATLSIGIARNAASPRQLHDFASLALDMALSRGGDQVVVKDGNDFSFIGGRSKETERRTKVKSRVTASAFSELLRGIQGGPVLIMGHKFPDMDVLGAAAGVAAICRKKGISAKIVRAPAPNPAEDLTRKLASLPGYKGVFINAEEARHLAGPNAMVVVVDTNRPDQTQVPELLTSGARVVVIDHHRRAASYIENPSLSFQDPYASSASELVTELVQYILDSGDLKKTEAEALLAGIVLDTKFFTMRTGTRTFETAAYLRKAGAETMEVNKFFQNNLEDTVAKYDIIRGAQTYRKTMALACTDQKVSRPIASQAADQLLNIAGVEASFVLFPEEGQTYLSARSGSKVNVQVLCEMLGGGGNAGAAGAQFPGKTPEDVLPQLKEVIDQYFAEEE